MDGSQQAEAMLKTLTEAQKKMWENWCESMGAAPVPTLLYPGVVDQWRAMATQGFKSWTAETEQVSKDVLERLLGAQNGMMHFLNLSLSAWKAIAPKAESGEEWHTTLAHYTDQLRQQFIQGPQDMAKAAQDTDELWSLYLKEFQKLGQPWIESLQRAPWHFGQAATGDGPALVGLSNLYWDAYERTFGRLLESPGLGHTREMHEKLLKGFDSWLDSRRASFEYQVMLSEGWGQAFEQFMRKLVSLAEQGQTIRSLQKLLFLWIDVIDGVFTEIFRTDAYIRVQGQLVNTAMAYKIREREIVEAFLKTSHVPSRSELDEAYRGIYNLRKEIRELKKGLHEVKTELFAQKKDPKGSMRPVPNKQAPRKRTTKADIGQGRRKEQR